MRTYCDMHMCSYQSEFLRRSINFPADQARYATYIVEKNLDADKVKTGTNFYKTTLPSEMIFTKADASTIND